MYYSIYQTNKKRKIKENKKRTKRIEIEIRIYHLDSCQLKFHSRDHLIQNFYPIASELNRIQLRCKSNLMCLENIET